MAPRRALVLALAPLLLSCGTLNERPSATSTAGPSESATPMVTATPAPSPSAAGSPTSMPLPETPVTVLDLAIGPEHDQPGATTPGVGGLSSHGPTSLAVDASGRIYLWDQSRVRILVYEGGTLTKILPEPFVERDATSLLAYGGRLYLRYAPNPTPFAEYEIDAASGELLSVASSLYPRPRPPYVSYGKGPQPMLFDDLVGDHYSRVASGTGVTVLRTDDAGAVRAVGVVPLGDETVDSYVAGDGAVYDLRSDWANGLVVRTRVVRVLRAAAGAPPEPGVGPTVTPRFADRDAPATIDVTSAPELPPGTLRGADARALWWLLSYARTRPARDPAPVPNADAYRMTARWPDGSTLRLVMDGNVVAAGGTTYSASPLLYRTLPAIVGRPSFLVDALRGYGATVRIADLPGVERTLTPAEVGAYADALGSAFETTFYERYRPLEDPFPRRQLVIAYPGGSVVIQDAGDRYLRVADTWGGAAWVHDGRASALLRRWLPIPRLRVDDPAILYGAEKVTIPEQDISRWKATIVRALVLPSTGPGQGIWDDQGPLVLTFTLPGGHVEVVRADKDGFTFAGKRYERQGLLDLNGLRGVP